MLREFVLVDERIYEQGYTPVIELPVLGMPYIATLRITDPEGSAWFGAYIRHGSDPNRVPPGGYQKILSFPDSPSGDLPLIVEMACSPSKPFITACTKINAPGVSAHFYISLGLELLDFAVYSRLMRAKRVTLKQIEACNEQVDEHTAAATVATEKQAELELETALWDNFLSKEIALYELLEGGE